jgi:hypothetical protein
MFLSEIRLLVGVHLGQKGLPPSIIAPVNNLLLLLDEELTLSGFTVSATVEKEMERLKNAVILMNYDPTREEDDIEEELDLEDTIEKMEEEDDEDDPLGEDLFGDDDD